MLLGGQIMSSPLHDYLHEQIDVQNDYTNRQMYRMITWIDRCTEWLHEQKDVQNDYVNR